MMPCPRSPAVVEECSSEHILMQEGKEQHRSFATSLDTVVKVSETIRKDSHSAIYEREERRVNEIENLVVRIGMSVLQFLRNALERLHGRLEFFLDSGGDGGVGLHDVATDDTDHTRLFKNLCFVLELRNTPVGHPLRKVVPACQCLSLPV